MHYNSFPLTLIVVFLRKRCISGLCRNKNILGYHKYKETRDEDKKNKLLRETQITNYYSRYERQHYHYVHESHDITYHVTYKLVHQYRGPDKNFFLTTFLIFKFVEMLTRYLETVLFLYKTSIFDVETVLCTLTFPYDTVTTTSSEIFQKF